MPCANIIRQVDIVRSPRVMQLEGIFDIVTEKKSKEQWNIDFDLSEDWNVGLILGPSGSGKTTIATEIFGDHIVGDFNWSDDKSIVDDFPKDMSIKDITEILSSVGFSSPPAWLRPYRVLSNGEKFRVTMARVIAESEDISVVDEFTSVVDRTVAKIGSYAIQKTIRKKGKKIILISCHYDVLEWLEPDWVYQPHINHFYSGRYLHQRPKIVLDVVRVDSKAWNMFRKHHYLDTGLNPSSVCFVAFWENVPVAFSAILHFPHPKSKNIKREHRTVCLPDYQGVGIGNALSDFIGSLCAGIGYRYMSQTSHPAMIRARARSANWKMIAKPNNTTKTMAKGITGKFSGKTGMPSRFRATFEYIGKSLDKETALSIWSKK